MKAIRWLFLGMLVTGCALVACAAPPSTIQVSQ
jgi:hypothetical protein